jgi:hypothetical protein
MELADPREIEALRDVHRKLGRRNPMRRDAFTENPNQPPAPKAKRCHCGICATCRENARWERIYSEKFADPDYYKDRYVRHSSSLDT